MKIRFLLWVLVGLPIGIGFTYLGYQSGLINYEKLVPSSNQISSLVNKDIVRYSLSDLYILLRILMSYFCLIGFTCMGFLLGFSIVSVWYKSIRVK